MAAAAQGARQGRERRVEKAHASCAVAALRIGQQPATTRLLPVSSLSLSISLFLFLSLSPLSSLSDHSRVSVFLASYHRTVPPASRRPINRVVSPPRYVVSTAKFVARPKLHHPNRIDCFFSFDIIKAAASRNPETFLAIRFSRSIILRFTCRRVKKCVSSHKYLFFQKEYRGREREREREVREISSVVRKWIFMKGWIFKAGTKTRLPL